MKPGRRVATAAWPLLLGWFVTGVFAQSNSNFTLSIHAVGTQSELTWNQAAGVLEQADTLSGPWMGVREALSPYRFTPAGQPRFFRLLLGAGGSARGYLYAVGPETNQPQILVPGISVYVVNLATLAQSARVTTDVYGHYLLPILPAGHYQLCWEAPGYFSGCSTQQVVIADQVVALQPEPIQPRSDGSNAVLFGQVRFLDHSPVRRRDPALSIDPQTLVRLDTTNGVTVSSCLPNVMGQYVLTGAPPGVPLRLLATCETVSAQTNVTLSPIGSADLTLSNNSPVIDDLLATLGGHAVRRAPAGATVQLSVAAHDTDGDTLHFLWVPGLSDGSFTSADSTNVEWTLPASAGTHLMYVRVSDGRGGYGIGSIRISTSPEILFTGQVKDSDGVAVPDATVTLGDAIATTDAGGGFSLVVTNDSPPFVLTIQKPGLAPISRVFDDENVGGHYTLFRPEIFSAPADQDISVMDSKGTEVFIPSNSLARVDGLPLVNPVKLSITTIDPCDPLVESPVSHIVLDQLTGATNFLASLGTAHFQLQDASSNALTLLAGSAATVALAISPACATNFPDLPPTRGLWSYDLAAGVWTPAGTATLISSPGGPVKYIGPGAVLPHGGYTAVDPVEYNTTIKLIVDRTINLPFDLRILGGDLNRRETIFVSPTLLTVPAWSQLSFSILSPNQAPGIFQTPAGVNLTDENKTVILDSLVFSPGPNLVTPVVMSLGQLIPYLYNVESFDPFLSYANLGDPVSAAAYYTAIDPLNQKDTLTKWKLKNGFNATDDLADDAKAYYFNATDLGFGRAMHMKTKTGTDGKTDVAFYVGNHPTVDHALQGVGQTATVAMDYALETNQAALGRIIKFYVFDATGQRVIKADLDHGGDKYVPWLCVICHGANFYYPSVTKNTNMGSSFLPFDISSYTYSTLAPAAPGAQDAQFKKMNLAITNCAYETVSTRDLVQNWYLNGTFDKNYAPAVWGAATNLPIYRDVLRITCRSCHAAQLPKLYTGPDDGFDLATPDNTRLSYGSYWVIQYLWMPRSQRPWTTFWGSKIANFLNPGSTSNQPVVLRNRYIGTDANWGSLP